MSDGVVCSASRTDGLRAVACIFVSRGKAGITVTRDRKMSVQVRCDEGICLYTS